MTEMRPCSKCQIPKPATAKFFTPAVRAQGRVGLTALCRKCKSDYDKTRQPRNDRNPEAVAQAEWTGPMRECTSCHLPKPLNAENFCQRTYPDGKQAFRYICRTCRSVKEADRAERVPRPERKPAAGKLCMTCGSMPWRVPAIKCPACGLRHEAEPKPELVFTRHFERAI